MTRALATCTRTDKTMDAICSDVPAWPNTSGTPVEFVLLDVVLYAASVKLYAVSNAPPPRPVHQDAVLCLTTVGAAYAAEAKASERAPIASIVKEREVRRGRCVVLC